MIYAQVHTFNENQTTIASRLDQPDASWLPFDVPDESWLYLDTEGVIQSRVASEVEAEEADKAFKALTKSYEDAVQKVLDTEAISRGYDNILSACSYAGAVNAFQSEGQSFVSWRGAVWSYCYQELAKVQAGTRTLPTIEQLISELPVRS